MIEGKTSTGFSFELNENIIDNIELVDALAEMEENPIALSKVMKMIFTDKTRKALYDHVRTKDGRVPVEAISNEIRDVFQAFGEKGKKSLPSPE